MNSSSKNTIRVYWINHDYFADREFANLNDAVAYARSTSFEASFWAGETMLGSYSYFGGFREAR